VARIVSRRGSSLVVPKSTRTVRWLGSQLLGTTQSLAAATISLNQSFAQSQIELLGDFTITRTIVDFYVASDQSVATETPFGALGMMVVREQARAVGVTGLPDPYDDAFDSGWFVHQYWLASVRVGTDVAFNGSSWFTRYTFESKGQRKVQSSDAIVVMLRNAFASHGAVFGLSFRMLIKTT